MQGQCSHLHSCCRLVLSSLGESVQPALKLADENVIMVFPLSVSPLILHLGDHPCVFCQDFRNYLKFFQFVRF